MIDFVAIDFETAKKSKESACSVGLVKFRDGKITDTYYSLVRPPKLYIRPDFTCIHGITADDVRDAPKFADIWDSGIKPFIGDFPLAAHFAQFDMGVLKAVLLWYKLDVPAIPYFCTCSLSRRTWPGLGSHSLPALAAKFNIQYVAHNALDDAMTCGKLTLMSAEKRGCSGIEELLSVLGLSMDVLG
ncbi:MAG: 3'-5' exonuclease [Treponema sp.]|jgi:DNA polymerase-3 subunit epsilon|nr:3'-5' exonuclease [Treponema sp.]